MDNWWLAASSWLQCTCSRITSHAEFFGETANHPGDSAPLEPRFGTLQLLAFPKTKTTFVREEISDCQWDSGKHDGEAHDNSNWGFWRVFELWKRCWGNSVRSQDAYFKGDWDIIVLCTMFLVSSSINASVFHIMWLDNFWTCLIHLLSLSHSCYNFMKTNYCLWCLLANS